MKDNSGMGSLFDSEDNSQQSTVDSRQPGEASDLPGNSQLASFNSQLSNYVCVDTEEKQRELVEMLKGVKMFAFDTETTSLEVLDAELVGFSFAMHNAQCTMHNSDLLDSSENSQLSTLNSQLEYELS